MKTIYKLSAFAFALIIAAAGFIPAVAYGDEAKQYKERIIEYNLQKSSADTVQDWIDGDLTNDAGEGSEWYIIALSNYGDYDFSNYNTALNNYLSANEIGSASSKLKFALTYIAIGDKTNPYINEVLGNSIGKQGIMSLVFGLHLLNNGYSSDTYSVNGLVGEILALQLADGGFSVTGEYGDVDVTAMTVQALAAYYENNTDVKSTVDGALDFLSARQLENGGYSAYGVENPESTAQVIIALSALDIDACADNRFIKNGNTVFDGISRFILPDGSFCHKEGGASDATATAQVLSASIAYENLKNGKSSFYVFNDIETVPEETTTSAIVTETTPITETAVFVENTSGITDTTIFESDTQKTEQKETSEEETDTVRIVIISVCVASILICAVLFATKKHKFTVLVIVAAVVAIALTVKISGENNAETLGSVTISISCEVIKDKDKSYIPENGIILKETEIEIENGDTVFDVLSEICKKENILFSANMGYIEGINNIFEMDFGKSSGWIYFVNGESPSVGCQSYELVDGDKIEWHYTCNLGKDLDIDFEK
ncbi:MAG: DUF4430 domain-containing protein [Clostridia bacterium]|nr:DUF4430 domain-containing protein [Clostridia bacterium]